jgi:hypothetical protein
VPCGPGTYTLRGQLLAADTAQPVAYGQVQLHSGEETWADAQGRFVFTIPDSQQRVVISATDRRNKLVQTTKIVTVDPLDDEVTVVINMFRKSPSVSFSASEETVLGLGKDHGDEMFAGIHIPAQSIYAKDGSVYTGEVVASVNVIDPRSMTDIMNAPSDFSFVDAEGEVQRLKTFGMFNLQLADPSGNTLQAQGDIQLYLDMSLLNSGIGPDTKGEDLPAVWVLDPKSGRWVQIGDMADGIAFPYKLVGNISIVYPNTWYSYMK